VCSDRLRRSSGELGVGIEGVKPGVSGQLEAVDAELSVGLRQSLLPDGAAGRMVELVLDVEEVAEPCIDALAS
jgi:hypothetical protein